MTRFVAVWAIVVQLGSWSACPSSSLGDEPPADAASDAGPQVLYLHTEFLPYRKNSKGDLPYRLSREIMRQAVLLAARDEMGLMTCDKTIHETLPDGAKIVDMRLLERCNVNGKWKAMMTVFAKGHNVFAVKPFWEKTYDFAPKGQDMYADIIPKLEVDTRGAFLEGLRTGGLQGEKRDKKNMKPPSEKIEALLQKVDFVSQFGAVKAAHQAIAEGGESQEWLGVLVRGYANLAMLTHHQWNAASDVFTARAWLYAQRMVAADESSDLALWHRAYAWALGGSFQHALADVELIEQRRNQSGEKNSADPEWTKLIAPYASSDRMATRQVGIDVVELQPWAIYLWFQLTNYYRHSDWMYLAAQEAAQVCPTAYGVYSELASHGGTLGGTRTGAGMAPLAFANFALQSIDELPNLPKEIRALLPLDPGNKEVLQNTYGDPNPDDQFSAVPTFIAAELRKYSKEHADADPSWSTLAYLLEEEQFVEIANYLKVSTNATESSLEEVVESLLPLVEGHRFAAYIESFRYNPRSDRDKLQKLLTKNYIADPRRNMQEMMVKLWYIKGPGGNWLGSHAYKNSHRSFTLPGIIEIEFPSAEWAPTDAKRAKSQAELTAAVAPGSEIGTRMLIQAAPSPTLEQLSTWEKELKEDPTAFTALARHYVHKKDVDSAVRCYDKSLALLPTIVATKELASLYLFREEYDKWEETLTKFLETENLGLEHAQAHEQLAAGFAHRGLWHKAKPHAEQAAGTWSAWGLQSASQITEGLAEWQESERWIREMSTNYPTNSGRNWYYWCRRTGRGDLDSARQLAQRYYAVPPVAPTREQLIERGTFFLLEEDKPAALDAFRKALEKQPSFSCAFFVAQLAKELGEDQVRKDALAAVKESSKKLQSDPNYMGTIDPLGLAIVELLETGDASPEKLAAIDEHMAKLSPLLRNMFPYFVGKELAALGKDKEAEHYWRREVVSPCRDIRCSTLAGAELTKRHGTSRPDGDVLDEKDLWPAHEDKGN